MSKKTKISQLLIESAELLNERIGFRDCGNPERRIESMERREKLEAEKARENIKAPISKEEADDRLDALEKLSRSQNKSNNESIASSLIKAAELLNESSNDVKLKTKILGLNIVFNKYDNKNIEDAENISKKLKSKIESIVNNECEKLKSDKKHMDNWETDISVVNKVLSKPEHVDMNIYKNKKISYEIWYNAHYRENPTFFGGHSFVITIMFDENLNCTKSYSALEG